MGWDGAGSYTRQHNFSADASAGIKILALRVDQELDDMASAMTIAWARNGQNTPTQAIPMGGQRFINVGAATSVGNYMRVKELIENVPIFMQDVETSADRISVSAQYFTSVSANQAPGDGTKIIVRAKSNKSSAVLYLNGHSANVHYSEGGRIASAITSGGLYEFLYSSSDTAWKVSNPDAIDSRFKYVRTEAEVSAGVTPTHYQYEPGDVRRYGTNTTPGTTDMRTAWTSAYAQFKAGGPRPTGRGIHYLSKDGANIYALRWDDDVILDGGGELTFKGDGTNNYTLLYANGGTSVKIDVRGVKFDCGKASPDRPSSNDDIGLRITSSIDTLNVENCEFANYNEDGIYINTTVTGTGGEIHNCRFLDGCRSAVTIVAGKYLAVRQNRASNIQIQPFNVVATDNTTVLRDISVDDNRIIGGGWDGNSTSDRCAIFLSGKTGASVANQQNLSASRNHIIDFGADYASAAVPYIFGIETREITDALVQQNYVTGMTYDGAGLYSYLTDRAVYCNNTSVGNDRGLWMNDCTDYTESDNVCRDNVTFDRDYSGPDGDTSYIQADGLHKVLARGSISFSGGTPSLNSSFNISQIEDLGTGDTRFTFNYLSTNGNYSVLATFRSFSGTTGLIQSASHTDTTFRIVTFSAGVASDESFDFEVVGYPSLTQEP